jgi:hypothetical protein
MRSPALPSPEAPATAPRSGRPGSPRWTRLPPLRPGQALGNPARACLRTVERHGGRLLARLEASGRLSHIHLDRTAPPGRGLRGWRRPAARPGKLVLLGRSTRCSSSIRTPALEQLAVDLAEKPDRRGLPAFLERTAEEFSLVPYAGHVLRLSEPRRPALRRPQRRDPEPSGRHDAAVVAGEGGTGRDRPCRRAAGRPVPPLREPPRQLRGPGGGAEVSVGVEESAALRSGPARLRGGDGAAGPSPRGEQPSSIACGGGDGETSPPRQDNRATSCTCAGCWGRRGRSCCVRRPRTGWTRRTMACG